MRLVKAAAELLGNDIRCLTNSKATYPSSEEISSKDENLNFIPDSLKLLLRSILSEKEADVKIAAIGQDFVQAARPRVLIARLQFGLGVQMHHHFSSTFLIETLSSLGICSSYTR